MTRLDKVSRLKKVPGIGVDKMGHAADVANDPEMLRLENLDTDILPPSIAIEVTREGIPHDENNSYLPFIGQNDLREAVTRRIARISNLQYRWENECIITAGGMSGILNCLLAMIEPGDEVIVTDPTYAGIINRIRLAGGEPVFVPLIPTDCGWRLDIHALKHAVSDKTRMLLMSPGMPTGHIFTEDEWKAIAKIAIEKDLWLLYDAAMERILYDGREVIHPASFPGMKERTVTVGAASKELRMIGWRVGWVIGPTSIMDDIALVSISNVVCQTGISMAGVAAALNSKDDGLDDALEIWQGRRDVLLNELSDFPITIPHGGWSLLIDASKLHMKAEEMTAELFSKAKIATTPMTGWGPNAAKYVRLVFSNEKKEKLIGIGKRIKDVL